MVKNTLSIVFDNKTEGAGSVYQHLLSAWIISRHIGYDYYHRKPNYVHHKEGDTFGDDWERIFHFLEMTSCAEVTKPVQKIKSLMNCNEINKNFSYDVSFMIKALDKIMHHCNLNELRDNFYQYMQYKPKQMLWKNENTIRICLHLRNSNKNDVLFGNQTLPWEVFSMNYNVPNQNHEFYKKYYTNMLVQLRYIFMKRGKNVEFHIFSQGDPKIFNCFEEIGGFVHLDEVSATDSFWHFLYADVFVMGKSSFSLLAGLLNRNIKIMRNYFRVTLPKETIFLNDDLCEVKSNRSLDKLI